MKYYKELLLKKLIQDGWDLQSIDDSNTPWWLESSWSMKSIQQSYGHQIYILFLVDPMYEGEKKSSAVWAVSACLSIPDERPLNAGICTMNLVKGKFDKKLTEFVLQISEYRNLI